MASHPSGMSTAPLSLVSAANLLWVHSIPLSMSLMEILNSSGPNKEGTPLVTDFHLDIELLTTALWMSPHKGNGGLSYLENLYKVSAFGKFFSVGKLGK